MDTAMSIASEISTPLPEFMMRENTCCFTGHRRIPDYDATEIPNLLDMTVGCLLN